MSNIAGKAYAINVITPHRPGFTSWLKGLIFRYARAMPEALSGLLGLSIIHFARWVIIKRDSWPDLGQGKQDLRYKKIRPSSLWEVFPSSRSVVAFRIGETIQRDQIGQN